MHGNLAFVLQDLGRDDDAIAHFETAFPSARTSPKGITIWVSFFRGAATWKRRWAVLSVRSP